MAKLTVYHKISCTIMALLFFCLSGTAQFRVTYRGVDKSDKFFSDSVNLQQSFANRTACSTYIQRLPALLAAKGYPSASVDSIAFDSTSAFCLVYAGPTVRYAAVRTDSIEPAVLQSIGWNTKRKNDEVGRITEMQEKLLAHMEDNGYPFASVYLDSISLTNDSLVGILKLERGPLYTIDSIRNLGTASISQAFLQQYLGIMNGSIYRKSRLADVSAKLRELPFLAEARPWDLTLLGTGSILNVYLDTRKSSEVNVLVGLLPSNAQLTENKMLVTGEANINLKNALGGGETIGLNWQQIQVKSPRLNLLFRQPYLFGSPFGLNFSFDLLKKDTSYVNINMLIGAGYSVSARQTGTVYLQRFTTNLLTVDTNAVKSRRRLPDEADLNSVSIGLNYEWFTTDYRFNPRRGNELFVSASAGTKTVRKNNVIVKLHDQSDPAFDFNSLYDTFQLKSYQFRLNLRAARYFPIGRLSTVRGAINAGWFQSPTMFRNELFQVGGYKTLRGFDEESIFATAYGIATAEYRYLIGPNSFLAAFVDYGTTANKSGGRNLSGSFLGGGLGMAFETKAGIFNISYAAGKRGDQPFNLRQSKIHLGYVNYF